MLKVIESSPVLAVSVQQAKKYLRVEHDEDDRQIKSLIEAATSFVEQEIGQSLLTKILKKTGRATVTKDGLSRVDLRYPPVNKVISVSEIWNQTDVRPVRRYVIEWERSIPSVLMVSSAKTFEVVYQSGFGDKASELPASIKQAILMLVSDMYDKRDSCAAISSAAKLLLAPYKVQDFI
ncbi:MAG: head-tail connector protein [Holosporales bacterium]|jgi:uncharacterized phiE125 gp8 family phage protein|nr:head-tail connector protein [Holosporales bacterium]